MSEDSPEDVLKFLDRVSRENDLPFLLVGGNAVNAHYYLRTTYDVDIAIREEDHSRWEMRMREQGYELFFGTTAFSRYRLKAQREHIPVDLMILTSETFLKLNAAAVTRPMGTISVHVPSAIHLIAMKLHALKQPHRMDNSNDLNDVISLIDKLELDVHSPEFSAIFEKYAEPELREQILARVRRRS